MRYELSQTVVSDDRAFILSRLDRQLRKIAAHTTLTPAGITSSGIEESFGSINRKTVASFSLRSSEGQTLITADVLYRPSAWFWLLEILLVCTVIGWLVPLFFYMSQREAVKEGVLSVLQNVQNEVSFNTAMMNDAQLVRDTPSVPQQPVPLLRNASSVPQEPVRPARDMWPTLQEPVQPIRPTTSVLQEPIQPPRDASSAPQQPAQPGSERPSPSLPREVAAFPNTGAPSHNRDSVSSIWRISTIVLAAVTVVLGMVAAYLFGVSRQSQSSPGTVSSAVVQPVPANNSSPIQDSGITKQTNDGSVSGLTADPQQGSPPPVSDPLPSVANPPAPAASFPVSVPNAPVPVADPLPSVSNNAGTTVNSSRASNIQLDQAHAEIENTLLNWAKAQEQNDAEATATYYAENGVRYFLRPNVSRNFILKDRRSELARGSHISLFQLLNLDISPTSVTNATVNLVKHALFTSHTGRSAEKELYVRSRLQLTKAGTKWKIVSERDIRP